MISEVQVHLRLPCTRCNGVGIIQHPSWVAWWAEHPLLAGVVDWTGCPEAPEEIPCPYCQGGGYSEEWVAIGELMIHADCCREKRWWKP